MQMGDSTAHRQASLHSLPSVPGALNQAYEGKVIAVHPEDSSVDVRLYDGQILRHVRVLFNSANTIAGFRYLSSIVNTQKQVNQNGVYDDGRLSHVSDTLATIIYVYGNSLNPRVIGFSFPLDSQMHVEEEGLALFRHESGVYSLIDQNGHHEIHYPDGSYIIMAPDSTPKSLSTGPQAQNWNVRNNGSPVNLTIHLSQGVTVSISGGNVSISGAQQINLSAQQSGNSASINIDGNGSVTASKTVDGRTTSAALV